MKTVEIYFHDLSEEGQRKVLGGFDTNEGAENWDTIPLAIIEREEEDDWLP